MNKGPLNLLWSLRSAVTADTRRRVRQITDPLSGPLGSIRGARTSERVVALTFDDGPDAVSTPRILDVLARFVARATFFVLVDRAEAHSELVKRILMEGHDVGLHGLDHRRLTRFRSHEVLRHIKLGCNRLAAVTGQKPRWFRPPYGAQGLASYLAARRAGLEVVVWSSDCEDWVSQPEEQVANRAVSGVQAGSVLLLHDAEAIDPFESAPGTKLDRARILGLVLQGLHARGFAATSVSGLLDGRTPHRTAWFRPIVSSIGIRAPRWYTDFSALPKFLTPARPAVAV